MSDRASLIIELLKQHDRINRYDEMWECECGASNPYGNEDDPGHRAHVAAEIDKALPQYEQVGAFDDRGLLHRECRETDAHRKCVPVYREVQP